MITRFATVYPGHIDLPDMGQEATPANERRYSNETLATVFEKTEDVARVMDELRGRGAIARELLPPSRQGGSLMNAIQSLEGEHEKAKAAFGNLIAAAPADRGRLWKALQPELKAHEEIEEACLYGPIEEEGVDDEKLTEWVSDMHEEQVAEVEELIEQTEQLDPKEPSWLATVRKIHDALAGHIRQEEGRSSRGSARSGERSGWRRQVSR